jgi:isopentenyl-diphosphate Delta-isomerase
MEMVVLVDEKDNAIGTMEKLEAHRQGKLHRAFSVLVFNSGGEMLLQKRASGKYHSAGLWTNACCSHPSPGEKIEDATRRRLREEMGIELQPEFSYSFIYKISLENDLIEHELDHVYTATFDGEPEINSSEVQDWKFVNMHWLRDDIQANPDAYTYWFKLIVNHPQLNF